MTIPRTAIVTGAAGGIGRALIAALAAEGWQVAALDIDESGLGAIPDGAILDGAIPDGGPSGRVHRIACDVADEASVEAARSALAWDHVGLLVNNAGIAEPHRGPVEELSLAEWRRVTDSHLTGAFLMVRAFAPALRDGRGAIVNMASTRAFMSEPDSEAYAAAKGGLVALSHALALSLGPQVRVNAIAPGWIVTGDAAGLREADHRQHPAGRAGRPEDVADAVLWLAGAGFVTGTVVTIDGGMTRKMIYEA